MPLSPGCNFAWVYLSAGRELMCKLGRLPDLIVRKSIYALRDGFDALQRVSTSQDLELSSRYISLPPLLIVHIPRVDSLRPSQPRELGFW